MNIEELQNEFRTDHPNCRYIYTSSALPIYVEWLENKILSLQLSKDNGKCMAHKLPEIQIKGYVITNKKKS